MVLKIGLEYIAFLDSDDMWYNYHLEECLKALDFTKYNFCSALWRVNAYGEKVNIGESGWFDYIFYLVYRILQSENLVTVNNFHFIYYYGKDNIYAFCVRGNEKFQKLLENKDTVKRITRNTINKIKLHKKMKKWVIESKFFASMKYWKKYRIKEEGKIFIKGEYRKNRLLLD